jgi:hypothetical protein
MDIKIPLRENVKVTVLKGPSDNLIKIPTPKIRVKWVKPIEIQASLDAMVPNEGPFVLPVTPNIVSRHSSPDKSRTPYQSPISSRTSTPSPAKPAKTKKSAKKVAAKKPKKTAAKAPKKVAKAAKKTTKKVTKKSPNSSEKKPPVRRSTRLAEKERKRSG